MNCQDLHLYANLDSVAEEVLYLLSKTINANTIFLASNDQIDNFIIKSFNREEILVEEGARMPFQDTLCRLVLENGSSPLVVPNLSKDSLTQNHVINQQSGNGSFLGTPIYTEAGKLFGTLCAFDSKPYEFTTFEVKLFKTFASLLSHTIIMEEALIRDSLTGLYNRTFIKRYFHSKTTELSNNMSVLYIDLDHFKRINDTFGHDMGDFVLKKVAAVFQKFLPQNSIAARLGGDEFVILLPEYSLECDEAKGVAEGILEMLSSDPLCVEGEEFFVSASIGVSCYPKDGEDMDSLLKSADATMYTAKKKGRNNVQFYQQGMNDLESRYYKLENALRQALKKEQFEIYYQPQFDLRNNRFQGMEALIRWNHPEWGDISPNEFIPIAEESGLIEKIGDWVFENVCKQGVQWEKQGIPPFFLSINLSPRQFENKELADRIDQVLEETGYNPHFLKVEITEGMLINDIDHTVTLIKALKSTGIHIAIDDFGTGYSSLSYLSKLPIDCIKLDRSFTVNLDNKVNRKIAKAVISLAKSLDILAVAEGIETKEHLAFLKKHGCKWGQGYYLGKPKSIAEIDISQYFPQ
ncbi:sensor domain-containing phosphodiesterase [Domibacillus tundrae]|uniref:sensor domain-containing phosphodiesterase n=1 Tax=Domibacillus tundrae TaxID=1587527 RepID=UPI000697A1D7|nr:EAL domain-containing protein [Domibacillus tundrae]